MGARTRAQKRSRAPAAGWMAAWTRRAAALALLTLGSSVTLACDGGPDADTPAERELVVFAASSLREVFGALGQAFTRSHPGVRVTFNFAGSQELRTQLELGASADVFASADEQQMETLARAGQVETPVLFARNELVLIVSTEARGLVTELAQLPNAARVVIGAPEVPVGRYTLELLDRAEGSLGPGFRARVLERVVSRELNVRQVLHKVSLGEAQAGLVYRTDALTAGGRVHLVSLTPELRVQARYPIARVSRGAQPELGRAFVALVRSSEGQRVLSAAGFLAEAGPDLPTEAP